MIRLSSNPILAAACCALALCGQAAAASNLVKDGGFESPVVPDGSFIVFSSGQTFANWTVVGPGDVAVCSGDLTESGIKFEAKSGKQWLDLTGNNSNSATGVQQMVATTPGKTYQLKFWVGNVIGARYGTSSTVDVLIDGVQRKVATNSAGNGTKLTWKRFKLVFTAASSSTAIAFINGDPSNDDSNGLDAVSLQAAKADALGESDDD